MKAGQAARSPSIEPRPAAASLQPCLIVNPLSFRNSRGLADQAEAIARAAGAEVVRADAPASLQAAVAGVLARRQRHLVVLAGDGTVQAIVDQLAVQPEGAWLPDLLVLPGGRSNLTAADLVPVADVLGTLKRGLRLAEQAAWEPSLVPRAVLRIEQAPAPPRHGFFVAGALIDSIIRSTHEHRSDGAGARHVGQHSSAWFVAGLGVRALFGRSGMRCPELVIDAGRTGRLQGATRVLLATTLQHAHGLFDPYADRGQGGLRLTAVARAAPRFLRSLPRLLTGRFEARMDAAHGVLSGRCERVEITGLAGYCLDGEEFDCDPTRPVRMTPVQRLRFLGLGPA